MKKDLFGYEISPLVMQCLTNDTQNDLMHTLHKIKDRILNKNARISVYFDTCFIMRDYFEHVYMILSEFVQKNNLPEGALEFIFLAQVEGELCDIVNDQDASDRNRLRAKRAQQILAKDKAEGHLFTYKKNSDRTHHDTVLIQNVIDTRIDREVIIFTNDYNLNNDLQIMNYLSSTRGKSIATIYISSDAKNLIYTYPREANLMFLLLADKVFNSWLDVRTNRIKHAD